MKTCPQCNYILDDEHVFCLSCGNPVGGDSAEQETVVNRKFSMPAMGVPETMVFCVACGHENKAQSKFCKKCGGAITALWGGESPQGGFSPFGDNVSPGGFRVSVDPEPDVTRVLPSPKFTPPNQLVVTPHASSNKALIVAAAVIIGITLVTIIMMMSGTPTPAESTRNSAANNANTKRNETSLPDKFDRKYTGTVFPKSRTLRLEMHLIREKSILTGSATTDTAQDELSGSIEPDGTFQANGTPYGQPTTGYWSGKIEPDGTIKNGTWTSAQNGSSATFTASEKKE